MKTTATLFLIGALTLSVAGCGKSEENGTDSGDTAGDGKPADGQTQNDQGHEHDEVSLGAVTIGEMSVELAQGHGAVAAGKDGLIVVKLPHNDGGKTIVRAWIGTEDRTLSAAGLGEYHPSHDDYDIHAAAPDPLPENVMWWIEIELPDGTKVVGSAKPIME